MLKNDLTLEFDVIGQRVVARGALVDRARKLRVEVDRALSVLSDHRDIRSVDVTVVGDIIMGQIQKVEALTRRHRRTHWSRPLLRRWGPGARR